MTRSDLADLQVIYQTRTERAVCIRETEDGPDVWARFDPFGRLTRTALTREPDDEHGIWERVSRDDADRARREQE